MVDTEHTETPDSEPTTDTLIDVDELAAPTPRITGSCSNPNWQPTQYVPYQP